MNPAEPLPDAQHERFACLLAKGAGVSAAYVLAGYKESPASATRLSKKVNVAARVEWLQEQAATSTVLSIREKREFLARVVRTPIGEVDRTSDLCQEVTETPDATKYKMPDKLGAIRLDNDLAGEGSEAKGQGALAALLGRLRG
jgi:hypothetical protein